jgi:hypothetical protein
VIETPSRESSRNFDHVGSHALNPPRSWGWRYEKPRPLEGGRGFFLCGGWGVSGISRIAGATFCLFTRTRDGAVEVIGGVGVVAFGPGESCHQKVRRRRPARNRCRLVRNESGTHVHLYGWAEPLAGRIMFRQSQIDAENLNEEDWLPWIARDRLRAGGPPFL